MLAGVDYVLMGGGIPLFIPGILDGLARLDPVELRLHVEDNPDGHDYTVRFNTKKWCAEALPELKRPKFLAIVSSDIIAKTMLRRAMATSTASSSRTTAPAATTPRPARATRRPGPRGPVTAPRT